MAEQVKETANPVAPTPGILGRIAQDIIVAYAWVAGPALSERQRVQQELDKSRRLFRGANLD